MFVYVGDITGWHCGHPEVQARIPDGMVVVGATTDRILLEEEARPRCPECGAESEATGGPQGFTGKVYQLCPSCGWDGSPAAPSIGQRLRQSTAPLCSRRGWYPRPCTGNHLPIAHQLRDDGYAVDLCEAQTLYDQTYDGLLRGSGMPTVSDWAVLCEIRRSREPVDDDDDDE